MQTLLPERSMLVNLSMFFMSPGVAAEGGPLGNLFGKQRCIPVNAVPSMLSGKNVSFDEMVSIPGVSIPTDAVSSPMAQHSLCSRVLCNTFTVRPCLVTCLHGQNNKGYEHKKNSIQHCSKISSHDPIFVAIKCDCDRCPSHSRTCRMIGAALVKRKRRDLHKYIRCRNIIEGWSKKGLKPIKRPSQLSHVTGFHVLRFRCIFRFLRGIKVNRKNAWVLLVRWRLF